ncbi:hypothetical protein L1887_38657 [Cichorium endivia]|nr:hypothetical protein L1887_38657 [Cichorium endivia]
MSIICTVWVFHRELGNKSDDQTIEWFLSQVEPSIISTTGTEDEDDLGGGGKKDNMSSATIVKAAVDGWLWALTAMPDFGQVWSFVMVPLVNCSKLYKVDLTLNSLVGTIPESVANCSKLYRVDLTLNSSTSSILATVGAMDVGETSPPSLKLSKTE